MRHETKEGRRPSRRRAGLQAGEEVVMVLRPWPGATWPKYLATLGLYGIWRKRCTTTITDRRVLIGRGVLSRTEHSIPLSHVRDAIYRRKGIAAYADLEISRDGQRRTVHVGPLSPLAARRAVQALTARI